MKSHIDHYRKPKGWVEFWVGLIVLILATCFFGRICYLENKVKEGDKAYFEKRQKKSD